MNTSSKHTSWNTRARALIKRVMPVDSWSHDFFHFIHLPDGLPVHSGSRLEAWANGFTLASRMNYPSTVDVKERDQGTNRHSIFSSILNHSWSTVRCRCLSPLATLGTWTVDEWLSADGREYGWMPGLLPLGLWPPTIDEAGQHPTSFSNSGPLVMMVGQRGSRLDRHPVPARASQPVRPSQADGTTLWSRPSVVYSYRRLDVSGSMVPGRWCRWILLSDSAPSGTIRHIHAAGDRSWIGELVTQDAGAGCTCLYLDAGIQQNLEFRTSSSYFHFHPSFHLLLSCFGVVGCRLWVWEDRAADNRLQANNRWKDGNGSTIVLSLGVHISFFRQEWPMNTKIMKGRPFLDGEKLWTQDDRYWTIVEPIRTGNQVPRSMDLMPVPRWNRGRQNWQPASYPMDWTRNRFPDGANRRPRPWTVSSRRWNVSWPFTTLTRRRLTVHKVPRPCLLNFSCGLWDSNRLHVIVINNK